MAGSSEGTRHEDADGGVAAVRWPEDGLLDRKWVANLTSALDWSSRRLPPSALPTVLPFPVLRHLLLAASQVLHSEPNLLRIDPPRSPPAGGVCSPSQVVVVGDVHGQLHDVIFLLEHAGFPSESRFFVFNGDYVDRGAWGLETFILLLSWKVFMPKQVFLLRGNHESKYCTSVYGFEREVLVKYGDQGPQVYRKCLRCFEDLPLASIIAGTAYTAHGGLFRSVSASFPKRSKTKRCRKIISTMDASIIKLGSLEELSKARRTVLDPPWSGANLIPGDVLWSDPSLSLGISPNNERGIGLLWGPDITEEFLNKHHLKLIIRSHEGPDAREKRHGLSAMDDGYTIDHQVESGMLITVFSAPDYPQFQATEERHDNRGAYIVLSPPDYATPKYHSFEAVKPRPVVNAYYDFEEVINSDEELDLQSMDTSSSAEGNASVGL